MIETLDYHLRRTQPHRPLLLAKLLSAGLSQVRSTAHAYEVSAESMFRRWPDLEYPKMLLEMLGGYKGSTIN